MRIAMIAKKDLEHNKRYAGRCRNSRTAYWDAEIEKFKYIRSKFGMCFIDEIEHPEDDRGFDLFIPSRVIGIKEDELEKMKEHE